MKRNMKPHWRQFPVAESANLPATVSLALFRRPATPHGPERVAVRSVAIRLSSPYLGHLPTLDASIQYCVA